MTPESNRLEYKRELTSDLEKEAVAFLNADGLNKTGHWEVIP
jgi:hypothetical protein